MIVCLKFQINELKGEVAWKISGSSTRWESYRSRGQDMREVYPTRRLSFLGDYIAVILRLSFLGVDINNLIKNFITTLITNWSHMSPID